MSAPCARARAFVSPSVYVTVAAGASRTCRRVRIFVLNSNLQMPDPFRVCVVHKFVCVISNDFCGIRPPRNQVCLLALRGSTSCFFPFTTDYFGPNSVRTTEFICAKDRKNRLLVIRIITVYIRMRV